MCEGEMEGDHPPTQEGRSSPQEDLDSEFLVGARGLADVLNLGIEPEAPLIRRLHIVVDQHMHAHLELVPPQQRPRSWPHIHRPHLHHAILRVTEAERRGLRRVETYTGPRVVVSYLRYGTTVN